MTETLIRNFITVAREKSISKAAAKLFISPPAVSKQLSSFEKELGVVCFRRTQNGLVLTPGGAILLEFYENYYDTRKKAVETARAANNVENLVLRIGVREDWNIADVFPAALAVFKKEIPGINVALNIFRDDALVTGLLSKSLDFVVATKICIDRHKNVPFYPLTSICRGPLLAADHPLAAKSDLTLEDLKNETFFLVSKADEPEGKSSGYDSLKLYCEKYNFIPTVQIVPSVISAYSMVLDKRGTIMVSDWTIQRYSQSYVYVPFEDYKIDIGASWIPGEGDPIKQSLYNCLQEEFSEKK